MREHDAIFANFINRFGNSVLLDYADTIVVPAFTDARLKRTYGKTTYQFYKVRLVNLAKDPEKPVLALFGQFVKDTELTRVQRMDPAAGLVHDERSMSSAPSAFFVLLLNNHRLIYFAETPHAPDLGTFRSTALAFLRETWRAIINTLYDNQPDGVKITKKKLRELNPIPTLEVIPLANREGIAEFVKRYDILKRIDFRLVTPNDELDAAETLDRVRKLGLGLNAKTTKVSASNSKGLDIKASIETVTEATESANQEIVLSGVDENGAKLNGNNESFHLSIPINDPPAQPLSLAKRLFKEYEKLVQADAIKAPALDKAVEKLGKLMGLL